MVICRTGFWYIVVYIHIHTYINICVYILYIVHKQTKTKRKRERERERDSEGERERESQYPDWVTISPGSHRTWRVRFSSHTLLCCSEQLEWSSFGGGVFARNPRMFAMLHVVWGRSTTASLFPVHR